MGLSAPRKRAKLSNDPNNTAWSRSENGFGHSLLKSQGWKPGETLGAKNAAHAHLHTAASSSHIKVALREDNLGLGAKKGSGQDAGQCTGLDVFQNLLGRLNGKSGDILKKEQSSRDQVKNILYTERRWGTMRFVSGGVLAGTDDEKRVESMSDNTERNNKAQASNLEPNPAVTETATSQKHDTPIVRGSKKERSKGSKDKDKDRNDKKERKRKREERKGHSYDQVEAVHMTRPEDAAVGLNGVSVSGDADDRATRARDKTRRKTGKAQRKAQRQEKRAAKTATLTELHVSSRSHESKLPNSDLSTASASVQVVPVKVAPIGTGSRFAVRQRYVQHKRLAVMDPKALNEIFMIKAN